MANRLKPVLQRSSSFVRSSLRALPWALLVFFSAPRGAAGDDFTISFECDDLGDLHIKGTGPFSEGETVVVTLVLPGGDEGTVVRKDFARCQAGGFDISFKPTGLEAGEYAVRIEWRKGTRNFRVKVESYETVDTLRENEEKQIVQFLGMVEGQREGLEKVRMISEPFTRKTRMKEWEDNLQAHASRLSEMEFREYPEAKGFVKSLLDSVKTLQERCIAGEDISEGLKTLDESLDGVRKSLSPMFAAKLIAAIEVLLRELDEQTLKGERKMDEALQTWRRYRARWKRHVAELWRRHTGYVGGGLIYPDAMEEHLDTMGEQMFGMCAYADAIVRGEMSEEKYAQKAKLREEVGKTLFAIRACASLEEQGTEERKNE